MILLNFSHPLTPDQLDQIEAFSGQTVERVVEIPCQVDVQRPLVEQATALADGCSLTPVEWQTLPLLINPPALNFIAVTLLAELHGRCGYFPAHVRLRPVKNSSPQRYEIAEILDLQAARDIARKRR